MTPNSSEVCQSPAGPAAALAQVCTLNDSDRAARWQIVEWFIATALDHDPLPDGVRFSFARHGETARQIIEFVRLEQACCARFAYDIEDGPGELLSLVIRARAEDLTALRALYLRPRS